MGLADEWRKSNNVPPNPPSPLSVNERLLAAFERNNALLEAQTKAIKALGAMPGRGTATYRTLTLDLTTARTDERITIQRPCNWLQFWTDGTNMSGISVKIGDMSETPLGLEQMVAIPMTDPTRTNLYVTSDARAGRNKLIIYFVLDDKPLELSKGGQDISLSELAARQGSIDIFDRRGEVLFQDGFEDGLNAWVRSGTAGYIAAASTDSSLNGQKSCKLVTNAVINNTAGISKYLAYPFLTKIGLEFAFTLSDAFNGIYQNSFVVYTGTVQLTAGFRFNQATGFLQYFSAAGAWANLIAKGLFFDTDFKLYHRIKMVIDLASRKYVRAILDSTPYDLSQYTLSSGASGIEAFLSANITAQATGAQAITSYIDDAIITHNEP